VVIKWGTSIYHLVNQNSQTPPVDFFFVFSYEDFGCEVFGGSAESVCGDRGFGEAEVGEFHVAVFVDLDVFGFEVTVDDVVGVEVLQREDDFRGVEFYAVFGEAPLLFQMEEKLSSRDVLHDHVDLAFTLEREKQFHSERTLVNL